MSDPFSKLGLTRRLAGVVCAADLPQTSCFQPVAPSAFVAIEHEISLKPIGVGSATIILELSDASGKPVEFQMTGDWVILLHVTLPDGKKLKRQIDVRGVRPNKASC